MFQRVAYLQLVCFSIQSQSLCSRKTLFFSFITKCTHIDIRTGHRLRVANILKFFTASSLQTFVSLYENTAISCPQLVFGKYFFSSCYAVDIEAAAVTAVKSVFKSCSHLSASDSAILTDAAGVAEILTRSPTDAVCAER